MSGPESDPGEPGRKNLGAVIAVVILVAVVLYLVHLLAENLKQQKCIMEGRRDCIALPQPDQQ